MTRNTRGAQPPMSASWASNIDGWAEDVHSVNSEDESGNQAPEALLSRSEAARLREAIEEDDQVWSSPSPESVRQDNTPRSRNLRESNTRESLTQSAAYGESPRRRNTRDPQSSSPGFIMPSVASLPQTDRQTSIRSSARIPHSRRQAQPTSPSRMQDTPSKRYSNPRPRTVWQQPEHDDQPSVLWSHVFVPSIRFITDTIGIAVGIIKPLLSYALAIWIIIGSLLFLRNFLTNSFNTALKPLCRIPGSSYLNLPFCEQFSHELPQGPAEFDKLMVAQAAFDEIFSASVGEGNLPLDMKRSETSIRDLRSVVQFSNLPSRNELVFEFNGFIETAKQAATDLAKYNTRIGRGIDKVLTVNKWTLQVLDGIADTEANRGGLSRVMSNVNIFTAFLPAERMTQELILEQYLKHTDAIQEEIAALIIEAEVLLRVLDNLDERLDVIGDITTRDGIKAQGNKEELFGLLWTKLGGNKNGVAKVNAQLKLLKAVSTYRKLATAHVAGTVVKLQAIEANLEDLRERVALPEVVGTRDGLPLAIHIEQIQLGVERLENSRMEGREIEGQRNRAILNRNERLEIDA